MRVNALPATDFTDNPTGCCPRFNPEPWRDVSLEFKDKRFVRATTSSLFHIPVNMGRVFQKTFAAIESANALPEHEFIVLSRDLSPWRAEHLFAATGEVPGLDSVHMSGTYETQVFEGAYKLAPKWQAQLRSRLESEGKQVATTYFYYTTCPKCAKAYGKNYVVGVAALA
ncbi:MAG: hydrolase [Pseudomonadota bacterium]